MAECIRPAAGGDVAADDEILQNIIRSNERLAKELAKMPPLPKFSSCKKPKGRAETAAPATPATAPKCFCPSFMRHRHEHEPRRRSSNSEASAACCRSRNSSSRPAAAAATSKSRTQTTHSQSMHCHGHEFTLDTHHTQHSPQKHHQRTSETETQHHPESCCHPCKTEPLPWLQQHLVLNQTLSSASACQATCQAQHLTVDAGSMAGSAPSAEASSSCRGPGSNALSASIKPKLYFEQLLQRDGYGCHKKPRPPVKVDVNVRLVPKQPKPKATHSLNETFVKEVDAVAQALNETFVKESTSPELAHIDEQLAELENDRERERQEKEHEDEEDAEEQEQTTKL